MADFVKGWLPSLCYSHEPRFIVSSLLLLCCPTWSQALFRFLNMSNLMLLFFFSPSSNMLQCFVSYHTIAVGECNVTALWSDSAPLMISIGERLDQVSFVSRYNPSCENKQMMPQWFVVNCLCILHPERRIHFREVVVSQHVFLVN